MPEGYRERLVSSIRVLEILRDSLDAEANSGHPDSIGAVSEQRRLGGKIEGVKLALSYYDEGKANAI